MYYFTEIACVITEIWMIHMFLKSVFTSSTPQGWIFYLFNLVFGALITVLSFKEDMAFVRLAVALTGIWACSCLIYRAKVFRGFLASVAFCALVAVTDVISALMFQCCRIDPMALMENHSTRSVFLIANHLILFALVMLVCSINRKNNTEISLKILLPICPCWLVSILLCLLLTWQYYILDYKWNPLFLIILLGLLYTNIIFIYYINRSNRQAQMQKELELSEHHYAMQQEYYDQLRIQQEETRALWHDLSKYLRASKAEASDGALKQVQEMLDAIPCVVDVNNHVASVILNEYVQAAQEAQVKLTLDVQVPDVLFVTAADLYVLIGNTMDNAIEACLELPPEERNISLKLKVHNSILFYEISNPFKADHLHRVRNSYHGFGLKNVSRCVEKYGGKMEISTDNSIFHISAHLNSI